MTSVRRQLAAVVLVTAVTAGACGDTSDEAAGPATSTTEARGDGATTAAAAPAYEAAEVRYDVDDRGAAFELRLVVAADGSFRFTKSDGSEDVAYDASTDELVSVGEGYSAVTRGFAAGPPDLAPDVAMLSLPLEMGIGIDALGRQGDRRVRAGRVDGNAVWTIDTRVSPNKLAGEDATDQIEATIDAGTRLPLRVVERSGGKVMRRFVSKSFARDPDVQRADFRLTAPQAEVQDERWRRTTRAEAEKTFGRDLPWPATIPDGYEDGIVTLHPEGQATGPEGSNPVTGPAVSASWRRGLDVITASFRPVGDERDAWSDPFGCEGCSRAVDRVRIGAGALRGATAEVSVDPQAVPHLWAMSGDLVVTVRGPLTRDELVEFAESLG